CLSLHSCWLAVGVPRVRPAFPTRRSSDLSAIVGRRPAMGPSASAGARGSGSAGLECTGYWPVSEVRFQGGWPAKKLLPAWRWTARRRGLDESESGHQGRGMIDFQPISPLQRTWLLELGLERAFLARLPQAQP